MHEPVTPEQVRDWHLEKYRLARCDGDEQKARLHDAMAHALDAATLRQQAARVDEGMVSVTCEDGNNYCRILTLLGMEEEGDPVAKVEQLVALEAALSAQPAEHPDDAAVDRFAAAMKEKLAQARAKGRGGWQDKHDCPQQRLSNMLRDHVEKGDPRDVANFCMFLHQRGEAILPRTRTMMELAADPSLREPAQPAERQGEAVAYFSADPAQGEFNTHKTLAEAVAGAESLLESAQDEASDYGWQDEPPQICYGVVLGKCVELEGSRRPAPEGSEFTSLVDYRLTEPTHPAAPVGVPDGMVLVPRERLEYACDLLAERKYGSDARSPGHNARLVIERVLADAVAPSAPQGEG